MIINKQKILKILGEFPDKVVIEDFIDQIIITAKIEKALDQFDRGEYMTSENWMKK